MCLAQGYNAVKLLRLKPEAPRSQVKHSTTKPLRSWVAGHNFLIKSLFRQKSNEAMGLNFGLSHYLYYFPPYPIASYFNDYRRQTQMCHTTVYIFTSIYSKKSMIWSLIVLNTCLFFNSILDQLDSESRAFLWTILMISYQKHVFFGVFFFLGGGGGGWA